MNVLRFRLILISTSPSRAFLLSSPLLLHERHHSHHVTLRKSSVTNSSYCKTRSVCSFFYFCGAFKLQLEGFGWELPGVVTGICEAAKDNFFCVCVCLFVCFGHCWRLTSIQTSSSCLSWGDTCVWHSFSPSGGRIEGWWMLVKAIRTSEDVLTEGLSCACFFSLFRKEWSF